MTKKQKFFAHEKKQAQQKNFANSFAQLTWSLRIPLNLKLKNQNQEQKILSKKIEYLQEMSKIQLNHSEDEQTTHEQHPSQK